MTSFRSINDTMAVLESYPTWRGLTLHSLTASTSYRCASCRLPHDSTIVASQQHA